MSHIFDAIQKSESEQPGATKANGAAELLAQMERRTAAQRQAAEKAVVHRGEERIPTGASILGTDTDLRQGVELDAQTFAHAGSENDAQPIPARLAIPNGFPVLRTPVEEESRLVFLTKPDHPATEAYRLSILRLLDLQREKGIQKVLFTSAIPEEGKSLTVANIACALAEDGRQRVLVIEGDLRRPVFGNLFGIDGLTGAAEWLRGIKTIKDSIYKLEEPGFWIMPAGSWHGKIPEILQSNRVAALMAEVENWFDWILVDAPPMMPLADTSVWMRLVDGILLVARQGVAQKRALRHCVAALAPDKLIGAVVNCATAPSQYGYYYNRYSQAVSSTS